MGHRVIRLNGQKYSAEEAVVHSDEAILVVNKAVGLPSTPERQGEGLHLVAWLEPAYGPLWICHRLDKGTSGLMVLARTAEAHRAISLQFQKHTVRKEYLALAAGNYNLDGLEVQAPLRATGKAKTLVDFQQGKPSLSRVKLEEAFRGFQLVRVWPVTGRPHQVRVHLLYLKSPVVGDALYDGPDLYLSQVKRNYRTGKHSEGETALNQGFLLHAIRLLFQHPTTGQDLVFEQPVPKTFEVCLKMLRKHAPAGV
jgi:Pseudouridylate synthases, 23S RNA-specific